jgi:hypothetical protein
MKSARLDLASCSGRKKFCSCAQSILGAPRPQPLTAAGTLAAVHHDPIAIPCPDAIAMLDLDANATAIQSCPINSCPYEGRDGHDMVKFIRALLTSTNFTLIHNRRNTFTLSHNNRIYNGSSARIDNENTIRNNSTFIYSIVGTGAPLRCRATLQGKYQDTVASPEVAGSHSPLLKGRCRVYAIRHSPRPVNC